MLSVLSFILLLTSGRTIAAEAQDFAKPLRDTDRPSAHVIPVSRALVYFAKHRSAPGVADMIALTKIARDGLGMKALLILGSSPEAQELDAFSLGVLASQMDGAVLRRKTWAEKVDAKTLAELKRNRELLKRTFSDQLSGPHAWPWFLYQFGEAKEAKSLLHERFVAESARVMGLKEASFFGGQSSLSEAESLHGALRSLSSKEENDKLDAELQKLKIHVSHLPQDMI